MSANQRERSEHAHARASERWGGAGCPFNIWALTHSSVMKHNSLIPPGTDGTHFKQAERGMIYDGGGGGGGLGGRKRDAKENTGMINRKREER